MQQVYYMPQFMTAVANCAQMSALVNVTLFSNTILQGYSWHTAQYFGIANLQ